MSYADPGSEQSTRSVQKPASDFQVATDKNTFEELVRLDMAPEGKP